ncbi:MAG: DUF853 family protein [Solirubrobacterales bacterium]|nr:DUF853 family protein [Solirubrobacterales bacterium]
MAGGIAVHLALRGLGLAWTWGLPLVALTPLVALVDAGAAVAVGVASITAVAMGIAWHRSDLERGGGEAQKARDRIGLAAGLAGALMVHRARAERVRGERVAIGETRQRRVASVPFGSREGRRGLVVGSPGSGKTVTGAAIATSYVDSGLPVFALDPKGDASLRDALCEAAGARGAAFCEWSHEGPATYNPLARGDATEIADKVLAGEDWSEPHYLRQAQRYLGWAVRVMQAAGEPRSLERLVVYLDPERLEQLGERCDADTQDRLTQYLDSLSARQRADLGGVRDRLAVLSESALGRYLDPAGAGEVIDLAEAWRQRAVIYFRLDADRYPLASQMLGAAVVSDLVSLTGELQRDAAVGLVAIDEFAAVGAREILRILSRSRSAGISVLVATQGLADLDESDGDGGGGMTRRVLSQVDFVIAHRQPEPEAAEQLSEMAGTRPSWTRTERLGTGSVSWGSRGEATRARTREFVRHPDEFKRLGCGEAIVIEPAGRRAAEAVRIWPRTGRGRARTERRRSDSLRAGPRPASQRVERGL